MSLYATFLLLSAFCGITYVVCCGAIWVKREACWRIARWRILPELQWGEPGKGKPRW